MIVDLLLSETGDLLFSEQSEESKPQKISFNISKTKAQKVSMSFLDVETVKHSSNNYLKVNFFINNNKPKMIANTNIDTDADILLIALKLKTALGELPERQDFGSKMAMFKHNNITAVNLKTLEIYLKQLLKEDIAAVNVKATPIIDFDNGYKQTVKVEIYSDSNLLLDYKIER